MNKKIFSIFSITIVTTLFCIFFLINASCVAQQERTLQDPLVLPVRRSLGVVGSAVRFPLLGPAVLHRDERQSKDLGERLLKIQLIFNCHLINSEETFKKIMVPLLEKNGIVFVDKNPDVTLVCGSPIQHMCTFDRPHILLDEEEFASASGRRKKCLKNPNLLALFKNTILRPKNLYTQSIIHHYKLIMDDFLAFEMLNHETLTQKEKQKIQPVLWDIYRSAFKEEFEPLKDMTINFERKRPIDAFFAGKITNIQNPPGLHREKLLETLGSIRKAHPNKKIVSHRGRLPKEKYLDLLKKSKIVVSPWGNGEWCWRDYEAIYSGAVVIKPNSDFVHAVPDLYRNNKYYIACNPDFSDLDQKISYILEKYENFIDMRKNARNLLKNHWDYEKIAHDLANAIKRVLKKNKIKT